MKRRVGVGNPGTTSFIDLARSLLALRKKTTQEFTQAAAEAGIGLRKAYYLAEMAERLQPVIRKRSQLERIGWTRLTVIAKHITKGNARALLQLAENNTVHQLTALMRNETPHAGTRTVLLHLSPNEYERFANAVLQHGGEKTGRGLRNQEQALMKIIQAKSRHPVPHPSR